MTFFNVNDRGEVLVLFLVLLLVGLSEESVEPLAVVIWEH